MTDQDDVTKEPDRALENAPTSSMDIQSLNNVVVSLRGLMKRVQLFTIQKLVRQSKQLRSKKGTVENQKKAKKAERLVQEVGSVKDVKIDHAIKYALGNTKTFEEVAGKGDLDTRAKVRLATHPLMVEKVKKWRGEHEDWKALAAFVLYKNTGRRYKKKKKKDIDVKSAEESTNTETPAKSSKTTKTKSKDEGKEEPTPSKRKKIVVPKIGDGESAKELARRAKTARNRQNHGETENVVEDNTSKSTDPSEAAAPPTITKAESGKNDAKSKDDNGSDSSEEDDSSVESPEKVDNEEGDSSVEAEENVDNEADESSEEDDVSETEETEHKEEDLKSGTKKERSKEDVKINTKNADDSESESSEDESDSGESDSEESDADDTKIETKNNKKEAKKLQTKTTKQTKESPKEVAKVVKLKAEPKPIGYKAGKDMAIKKIDLTKLSDDVEDIPVASDVSFLFTASKADDIPKPKPKKKDAFFAMDSGEDEDEDDKVETVQPKPKREREKINYDNDVGMERKQHHKKIESAFIGRLSDKQAKGDWGYGKGSFSRPPPEDQGPWGRGRGGDSRGRGRPGFNQGAQQGRGQGDAGHFSSSTGSEGPQKDKPVNAMYEGAAEGKLHPSWEAKRKRKEEESKIAEFKGKKIKFDD